MLQEKLLVLAAGSGCWMGAMPGPGQLDESAPRRVSLLTFNMLSHRRRRQTPDASSMPLNDRIE